MTFDLDPLVLAVILLGVAVLAGLVVAARRRRSRREAEQPPGAAPAEEIPPVSEVPPAEEIPPVSEAPPAEEIPPDELPGVVAPESVPAPPEEPVVRAERFRRRLTRTRNVLSASLAELFGGGVTDEAWEGLEEALITADVGVSASLEIVEELRRRSREEGAASPDAVLGLLKEQLEAVLRGKARDLGRRAGGHPTVWLVTGVNGTGKTTTIGKLAAIEQREGRTVVLAAADTFRAAAADQLGVWAQRTGARLVRKDEGADPASVAYEAYEAASADGADVLIVDTAGRLHNKRALMDELGKVKRVLERQAGSLDETLLVLDATTGQNGIAQARAFLEAVEVTGIALTKLDGSSKGGIVVAVQRELDLPVKLVGLGEGIEDLAPFDPHDFVEGLFADVRV